MLVAGVCDVYNLTPDYIDENMTLGELYAYSRAASKYRLKVHKERAIYVTNTLGKSLIPKPTQTSDVAKTYEEFSLAMGVKP